MKFFKDLRGNSKCMKQYYSSFGLKLPNCSGYDCVFFLQKNLDPFWQNNWFIARSNYFQPLNREQTLQEQMNMYKDIIYPTNQLSQDLMNYYSDITIVSNKTTLLDAYLRSSVDCTGIFYLLIICIYILI